MLNSLKTRILQNFSDFLCQRYLKFSRSQANFNTFDFHRATHFLVSLIRSRKLLESDEFAGQRLAIFSWIKLFADRIDNFMASGLYNRICRFLGASSGGIGRTVEPTFLISNLIFRANYLFKEREREKKNSKQTSNFFRI